MNQLISAIGITVVSACCLQAANNGDGYRVRLGAGCAQVVLQHIGYVKTDSDGREVTPAAKDAAKLGLIQTNRLFKELLDRQRINDAPITNDNNRQYPCINTQVIYNETDKIIWDDNVTKYVIDAPCRISGFEVYNIVTHNRDFMHIYSLVSGNDYYGIYFIRNENFFKDFTVSGEYSKGINGGFFMFKLPQPSSDIKARISYEINLLSLTRIFVDDRGVTSPVSNIKDATKINQPGVNKVLARRVEFKNLEVIGQFNAGTDANFRALLDETCGLKHGNRIMLDNATKREKAVDVLKGNDRQLSDIENEVTIGDCLNGEELTIAEKTAFSAILWGKIQSFCDRRIFRSRNLLDSDKADMAKIIGLPMTTLEDVLERQLTIPDQAEMADMARVIGAPMATVPTLEGVLGRHLTIREINAVIPILVRKVDEIVRKLYVGFKRSLTENEKTEIAEIVARR